MDDLVKYWNKLEITSKELIHPCDVELLKNNKKINCDFEGFISEVDNLFDESSQLHTGLIPVPYVGNLKNASIYLLMINPGFGPNDYYSEYHCDSFRNELKDNLIQKDMDNKQYPLFYLNPQYCHTGGGQYWLKKFGSIIRKLNKELVLGYENTLKLVAKNVCVLELFPYHSKNFNISNRIIRDLESTKVIKEYLDKLLKENNKIVLCLRQPKNWGVLEGTNGNCTTLDSQLRQSASLNVEKDVGKIIYNKLCESN